MGHEACQLLFEAGKALVERSGLALYCAPYFVACGSEARFDEYWKEKFHPTFGRYMAWVLFSVGAENLAKAACVCHNLFKPTSSPRLSKYTGKHFNKLFGEFEYSSGSRLKLTEGYRRLNKVRDRDAHAYRENERSANFPLVKQKFVPAFNVLVDAMNYKSHCF